MWSRRKSFGCRETPETSNNTIQVFLQTLSVSFYQKFFAFLFDVDVVNVPVEGWEK
jgi:hypothetical protein